MGLPLFILDEWAREAFKLEAVAQNEARMAEAFGIPPRQAGAQVDGGGVQADEGSFLGAQWSWDDLFQRLYTDEPPETAAGPEVSELRAWNSARYDEAVMFLETEPGAAEHVPGRTITTKADSGVEAAVRLAAMYGVTPPPEIMAGEVTSWSAEITRQLLGDAIVEWKFVQLGDAEHAAALAHTRGEPVPEWAREQLAAETARLIGRALGPGRDSREGTI